MLKATLAIVLWAGNVLNSGTARGGTRSALLPGGRLRVSQRIMGKFYLTVRFGKPPPPKLTQGLSKIGS
jgi:hypothetical protein